MGILYVVATPIGNLDDFTKRAIDTLKQVDIILCEDTRHSLILLNHYEIKNRLMSYHKFNEKEKVTSIIEMLKKGQNIALISDAGLPCVSDPGYILVEQARLNNIPVIGVGGISASLTSLSISGIDSSSFTFYGFFPREVKDKKELISNIKKSSVKTFIFYESPKRIIKTLEFLQENLGNAKICVCSDLTKLHEKSYFGFIDEVLKELKENPNVEKGEYTFVIENYKKEEEKINLSIEARLIDIMITKNISLKEAIDILNKEDHNLSKKDIYNASLNLKNILKNS